MRKQSTIPIIFVRAKISSISEKKEPVVKRQQSYILRAANVKTLDARDMNMLQIRQKIKKFIIPPAEDVKRVCTSTSRGTNKTGVKS